MDLGTISLVEQAKEPFIFIVLMPDSVPRQQGAPGALVTSGLLRRFDQCYEC